jgi:curli production assembly/transport component CsgG/holdfast attachment protein HfaB
VANPKQLKIRTRRQVAGIWAFALAVSAMSVTGCTTWTPQYNNVTPVTGPAPYVNRTPMQSALVCLQSSTRASPDIRLGVADFVDGSGASLGESDVNGRYFSQRPDLMLIVALSKTGVRLVNRTSTAVAEWEMRQAMDRRLGEGKPVLVGQTRFDYRPVRAGEFLGSTFYVNGAITEINWAISSNVEEAGFLGATAGRRTYRVSIAIDLVVTNSLTTEVVFARSYSKQLVGFETGAGVFRFVEASIMPKSRVELFQANIGQKQNEPVQAALRWLVELAGYETVSALTGGDARCDALVPGQNGEEVEDDAAPPTVLPVKARSSGTVRPPDETQRPENVRPVERGHAPPSVVPTVPAPEPAPVAPVMRTRAPRPVDEAAPPSSVPMRAGRMAGRLDRSARSPGDDAIASVATATMTASSDLASSESDSRGLPPPALEPRPVERGDEHPGVQPDQPAGRLTLLEAIQEWFRLRSASVEGTKWEQSASTMRLAGAPGN